MTARTALPLLLVAAGCASGPPARPGPPPDLPPLPRSSIVAVLSHRGELELTDDQVTALEQADAALQQRLIALRAEGGLPPPQAGAPAGAPRPDDGIPPGGAPRSPGLPGAPGTMGGGMQGPGFGMNMGPGGFQLTPGGMGGGPHGGQHGGPHGAARRDPAKVQEALEARLDDADTAAFLKAEQALTAAQRERAREIATRHREQLFERREALRGR